VSYQDNYIKFPRLSVTYASAPYTSKDDLALSCLAEIIGQGKSSIFYEKFVKTQKASQAAAFNRATELSGEFSINVAPFPGQKLSDMEKIMRESFAAFEQRGVSDDALQRFKAGQEAGIINSLQSVAGKVSQLAFNQTFFGNPNQIPTNLVEPSWCEVPNLHARSKPQDPKFPRTESN
jgi:zinc protease